MIGQAKVRFCIVLVLIAGIFAVVGCSQSPSDEEIRQVVQAEIAKLELPEGERGPQGETGAQGERGPQAEAGAQGERGTQGEAGHQGERGERGPQAEAGSQGERGSQGPEAEAGPQGERGPQGEAGAQGERGERGRAAPPYHLEQIDWDICEWPLVDGGTVELECGFVEVPADYLDPDTGSINIAVNVHRATSPDKRIGYLFVNPGGPGESGLIMVASTPFGQFSDEITERFDIVGFDPRGVGWSEPKFACGEPGEQLALRASVSADGIIDTPEEIAAGEAAANLCIESMGPVGGLLNSAYVALDMDGIREALGAEQISYWGGSYGSALGAWYATLFSGRVRAMVVDGASNPVEETTTLEERVDKYIELLAVREEQWERALLACDDPQCPIYNDGDPIGYYMEAAEKLELVNDAAGGYPLAGYLGVFSNLYAEASWPTLWQGLFELNENDDPTILLDSARIQFVGGDPTVPSFAEHVNCLDRWLLPPALDRAARLEESAATTATEGMFPLQDAGGGAYLDHCPFYDQFTIDPLKVPLDGGGVPILVIGNREDPATPFVKSEAFATETLSNGYLVETSHATHVVYPNNECVNGHVHRALIDGVYPSERRVFCEREDPEPAPALSADVTEAESLCEIAAFECSFVEVPADYRDPEAGSISIAFKVYSATSPDERIGYLFVNPGGTSRSGVEKALTAEFGKFTDEILDRFDIVGFDPRGVGSSEPDFACGAPGEQLRLRASVEDGVPDTPEEIAAMEAAANLCIESMGPIGGLLHTEYVARDMDEIRKALGAEQISYLGADYGSTLGAWYATLFPESVRAMVVDGVNNPVDAAATMEERIGEAIEEAGPIGAFLGLALSACNSPECPIYNDGDPIGYYMEAAAKLDLVNSAAGGYPQAGYLGVVLALRGEVLWPYLWQGLFELNENDDPTTLLGISEVALFGNDPRAASFAEHVDCLDNWTLHPMSDRDTRLEESAAIEAALEGVFPLLDAADRPYPSICPFYDRFAPGPLEGPLDGGGVPILVIGNHNNPFNSFLESEEFATEVLNNGYLVETYHSLYIVYPDNMCVNDHIDRALIDGEYPSERRVFCERED